MNFHIKLNKELSYALRHAPYKYDLEMDEEGFVSINQLLAALNESITFRDKVTLEDLEIAIHSSDKERHEIVGDKIRALYGHTIPMHIKKIEGIPPKVLYHGTPKDIVDVILKEGLKPMSRQYVHLSKDIDTAMEVGKRRDLEPAILKIDTQKAIDEGVKFYIGNEKVWLADYINPKYISKD